MVFEIIPKLFSALFCEVKRMLYNKWKVFKNIAVMSCSSSHQKVKSISPSLKSAGFEPQTVQMVQSLGRKGTYSFHPCPLEHSWMVLKATL